MAEYRVADLTLCNIREHVIEDGAKGLKEEADLIQEQSGPSFPGSADGEGKLRYISGFCISKVKFKHSCSVGRNNDPKNFNKMTEHYDKVTLLDYLTEAEENIKEKSKYKETLQITIDKQNLSKGLTHVSDDTYLFFRKLDSFIRSLESEKNLNFDGYNMYAKVHKECLQNGALFDTWKELFKGCLCSSDLHIRQLYEEIVKKFVVSSCSTFVKSYILKHRQEKKEAHRKQIKMSKTKKNVKSNSYTINDIVQDTSENKKRSHLRLKSDCFGQTNMFNSTAYTLPNLRLLCRAYKVNLKSSTRKADIADLLRRAILERDCIPDPDILV